MTTNNNNETTIAVEFTKRGHPALWECGGGMTHRGSAQIICRCNGEPKTFTYAPHGGHLACGQHALFIVEKNDIVIKVFTHNGGLEEGHIYQILDFQENKAVLREINNFSKGEWDQDLGMFEHAVKAAHSKACDYHCRNIYYGKPKEQKAQ